VDPSPAQRQRHHLPDIMANNLDDEAPIAVAPANYLPSMRIVAMLMP